MIRRLAHILAWLAVGAIVFATLSPIQARPKTGHPDLERFGAFLLAGALFSFALPNRRKWLCFAVVIAAFVLEAAQLLRADRDARLHDAIIKSMGGLSGVALAQVIDIVVRRLPRQPGARS